VTFIIYGILYNAMRLEVYILTYFSSQINYMCYPCQNRKREDKPTGNKWENDKSARMKSPHKQNYILCIV
jgi:hypothetical protein